MFNFGVSSFNKWLIPSWKNKCRYKLSKCTKSQVFKVNRKQWFIKSLLMRKSFLNYNVYAHHNDIKKKKGEWSKVTQAWFFPLSQKYIRSWILVTMCLQARKKSANILPKHIYILVFFLPSGKFANMKIHGENLNIWYLTVLRCLLLTQVTSSPSSSQ